MSRLRRYFVAGLLTILPIFLTLYVLWLIFLKVGAIFTQPLGAFFERAVDIRLPRLALTLISFILTMLVVVVAGMIASNVFGRRLLRLLERLLENIPIARSLYGGLKQVAQMIFRPDIARFSRVVLVPFPTDSSYCLAFVTCEDSPQARRTIQEEMVHVFLPTTPNPTSGFFLIYPKSRVKPTDIAVEEALQLIFSGGITGGAGPAGSARPEKEK